MKGQCTNKASISKITLVLLESMPLLVAGIPNDTASKQNYCQRYNNVINQDILDTYLDQATMHTNQSYFFHFGVDGATDWTMVDENELAKNISVISDQELTMFFNLIFYNITFESDLVFRMQADDSFNPSILTVVEIDTQQEKEMIIQDGRNNCVLTLVNTKDRIKCTTSDPVSSHACGERNMPAKGQTSNRLLLKRVLFQPRGPGSYAANDLWSRNKYTWSGTKHIVVGETKICPFIGKC